MTVENWSEDIVLVELQSDPAFSDEINQVIELAESRQDTDVAINFQGVTFLNSSNIAKLLKLRKLVTVSNKRKLILCAINTHVWGVFLVTGLDKLFDFADDVASGLASLQIDK